MFLTDIVIQYFNFILQYKTKYNFLFQLCSIIKKPQLFIL